MTGRSDPLVASVCELCTALAERNVRPIIAGGLGLYLRESFLKQERQLRYPLLLDPRTTQDIDVFLTAEMIVDLHIVETVRDVLRALGYSSRPEALYFQFVRTTTSDDNGEAATRPIKVDLLAGVPDGELASLVTGTGPRIRPLGARGNHARRTPEAALIHVHPVQLLVPTNGRQRTPVLVPSSINYLILKLHALRDRVDDSADFGRHHAWDIMRIVTGMVEEDWTTAAYSRTAFSDAFPFQEARRICEKLFGTVTSPGFIRLQENEAFRSMRRALLPYVEMIRGDLAELFGHDS